jgi:transposase
MVYSDDQLDDDEYPTCPVCNGELGKQPHWSYWFCDTCGHKEHLEQEEP